MATAGEVLQHEFVNVNGIIMHYVTIGNGPLIIFLHGFPKFWYSWRHQIDIESYVSSWSKEGGITGGINYYRSNLNAEFWGDLLKVFHFQK